MIHFILITFELHLRHYHTILMPYEMLLPPFIPTPVHGWTGCHSPPADPSLSLPPISFNTLTQAQTWDNFSYSIPSEGDSDNGRCSICNLLNFVFFGNLNIWQMPNVAKDEGQYSWGDIYKTTYLKGCTLIYCKICGIKSKWVKSVTAFKSSKRAFPMISTPRSISTIGLFTCLTCRDL